jgi:hypothetical protein
LFELSAGWLRYFRNRALHHPQNLQGFLRADVTSMELRLGDVGTLKASGMKHYEING